MLFIPWLGGGAGGGVCCGELLADEAEFDACCC